MQYETLIFVRLLMMESQIVGVAISQMVHLCRQLKRSPLLPWTKVELIYSDESSKIEDQNVGDII